VEAPRQAGKKLAEFVDGLGTYRRFANLAVESSLNGPIGPHRRWCWATTGLADVKKIRSAFGGTVNDVVLATITQGFRDLLESRGEPVAGLCVRSLVPVSVRRDEERGTYNNRVSATFAELPVGIADPVERLASIREQMDDLKRHHQAAAGETLTTLSEVAPPVLMALGARLFAGLPQRAVQTVTTNVPGPQRSLYAAGRPMRSGYLYVPLAGSVRIGVAIFSYAGELSFGVTGDFDTAPDIEILAAAAERPPRPEPIPDRHVLHAAHQVGADPLRRARELRVLDALEQLREQDAQLEPRQRGAQAEVLADAEGEVRVRGAVDAEGVRIGEHLFVAVRGGVEHRHRLALRDALAAQRVVGGGGAREVDHRRGPAQDLLHRRVEQAPVFAQPLPLAGVFEQRQQAAADRVARRLVAGRRDDEAERDGVQRRDGRAAIDTGKSNMAFVWCVRGGSGVELQ
jgi:hypothetical protein